MTEPAPTDVFGVYGSPVREIVDVPANAQQFSPLVPGAAPLAACADATLDGLVMQAPPGTIERRRALSLALRALKPDAWLTALAPKDKGGARIAKELIALGFDVEELSKRHHRIVHCRRPETLPDLEAAISEGAMRFDEELGLWTQPGIFSWDRIDPGTDLLLEALPTVQGVGADLGSANGALSLAVLQSEQVTGLHLFELDGRALEAARHNITDTRAHFHWADLRRPITTPGLTHLDFVVMNAPFHDGGVEDRSLVATFVERAASGLRKGGTLWMVANRHLPYEAALDRAFAQVRLVTTERGYKVFEALK